MASKTEENTQYIATERMYSAMRSTSALYPSYPCHNKQSSDEKPQPGFGKHDHEQFNGQLHSAMNPSYSTPPSNPMHQNQNHGFGVQQTLMANDGPFYNPVQNPSYSTPASYPMHQNQNYGSGVQQNLMRNRPFSHPLNNPSYSTPASYTMYQNQNYGFGMQQSSMKNEGPFYHSGFNLPYPAQETLTYPVGQPAPVQAQEALIYMVRRPAAAQEQAQQVEVKRNAEEEVLNVTLEPPNFPLGKPRLRWTLELHERFIRAATQLGGVFKATPKAILGRMNVRGLTSEHLKSHLQKARRRKLHNISVEEITGHGIPSNANSSASPSTEVEASSSYKPNYESDTARNGTLLRTSETLNYHQNRMIALSQDHAN